MQKMRCNAIILLVATTSFLPFSLGELNHCYDCYDDSGLSKSLDMAFGKLDDSIKKMTLFDQRLCTSQNLLEGRPASAASWAAYVGEQTEDTILGGMYVATAGGACSGPLVPLVSPGDCEVASGLAQAQDGLLRDLAIFDKGQVSLVDGATMVSDKRSRSDKKRDQTALESAMSSGALVSSSSGCWYGGARMRGIWGPKHAAHTVALCALRVTKGTPVRVDRDFLMVDRHGQTHQIKQGTEGTVSSEPNAIRAVRNNSGLAEVKTAGVDAEATTGYLVSFPAAVALNHGVYQAGQPNDKRNTLPEFTGAVAAAWITPVDLEATKKTLRSDLDRSMVDYLSCGSFDTQLYSKINFGAANSAKTYDTHRQARDLARLHCGAALWGCTRFEKVSCWKNHKKNKNEERCTPLGGLGSTEGRLLRVFGFLALVALLATGGILGWRHMKKKGNIEAADMQFMASQRQHEYAANGLHMNQNAVNYAPTPAGAHPPTVIAPHQHQVRPASAAGGGYGGRPAPVPEAMKSPRSVEMSQQAMYQQPNDVSVFQQHVTPISGLHPVTV